MLLVLIHCLCIICILVGIGIGGSQCKQVREYASGRALEEARGSDAAGIASGLGGSLFKSGTG